MKKFASLALAFLFFANLFALEVPELAGPVMDTAGIMSQKRREELEEYLYQVDQNSTAQIAVLTIPSLEGESLEEYAIRVAREWGLGESEDNKGVLLLVAYKEKKIRIETGYGAEADLTDAKCGMIIRNVIAPEFQNNNYSGGIIRGVKAIAGVVAADAEGNRLSFDDDDDFDWPASIALLIFFTLYFIMFTGSMATKFSFLSWLPWASWFIRHAGKGGSGHSSADFFFGSSGSSSGFGSSGGGFSGGGGGFGGGGASGGW